jgi:hypothetical protein
MKSKEDIFLCANCSLVLDKEDIECCDNLSLGKMFCKDCLFTKFSKLTGFNIEDLESYLQLDNEKFFNKMEVIKKKLSDTFKQYGEFERY